MHDRQDQDLALWLLRQTARGKLSPDDLKLCLAAFFPESGAPSTVLPALLARLAAREDPASQALVARLQRLRQAQAVAYYRMRRLGPVPPDAFPELADLPTDLPPPWTVPSQLHDLLGRLTQTVALTLWQQATLPELTRVGELLARRLAALRQEFEAIPEHWDWLALTLPPGPAANALAAWQGARQQASVSLDDPQPSAALLVALEKRLQTPMLPAAEQAALLDRLLAWPSPLAAAALARVCGASETRRERVSLSLKMRLGQPETGEWPVTFRLLEAAWGQVTATRESLRPLVQRRTAELAWLALSEGPAVAPPELLASLASQVVAGCGPETRRKLGETLAEDLAPADYEILLGQAPVPPLPTELPALDAPLDAAPAAASDEAAALRRARLAATAAAADANAGAPTAGLAATLPPPPAPKAPLPPAEPTLWSAHLQPFLLANWYLFAGLLMVVVGASLLAYFSWHNLFLRLTLVPAFLAAFTFGLAAMGDWLARREEALGGTAAMLRGGAVCLVPVNFMILPLLARDAALSVAVRQGALLGGSLVFLGLFAWGLRRWCRAVHPPLARHLAPALLAGNLLLPIAAIAGLADPPRAWVVVLGCYVVTAIGGWLTLGFLRQVLTLELMQAGRVPWFFGATLALTLAEVLTLAHWALGMTPPASHYGALAVLLGGLVLRAEHRALELRGERDRLGSESFIGYAAILLGVALAMPHAEWRVPVLWLAGGLWLAQAGSRRGELHHWLGLCLLVAGGAAIGLHPLFPRGQPLAEGGQAFDAVGLLGLALAGVLGAARVTARRLADPRLSRVAQSLQPLVLALAALATIMVQWQTVSPPLVAGGVLLGIAALFAWRAHRQQHLPWVHTAMAMAVLALPYLGCGDMVARTVQGNVMGFGLSLLAIAWLALVALRPTPLLLAARSTVLWGLGATAVAAVLIRLVAQVAPPAPALAWRLMDQSGPLMMAVCMGVTAWLSRSLVPGILAAVLLAVLFPELQRQYPQAMAAIGWGNGLGTAGIAGGLLAMAFALRQWLPGRLPGGDRFLGQFAFPLRREDHTLFTWPLLGTTLFLALKLVLAVAPGRMTAGAMMPANTAWALVLGAVVYTALAIYLKGWPGAKWLAVAGWLPLLWGTLMLVRGLPATVPTWETQILALLGVLYLLALGYHLARRRWGWLGPLLAEPLGLALAGLGLLLAFALGLDILGGDLAGTEIRILGPLLVLHLAACELRLGKRWHGGVSALFGLLVVVSLSLGELRLGDRALRIPDVLNPLIGLGLGIATAFILLEIWERHRGSRERWRTLSHPWQVLGLLLALGLLVCALGDFIHRLGEAPRFSIWHCAGVILLGLLVARAEHLAVLVLLATLLGYGFGHHLTQQAPDKLFYPIHLGSLVLCLTLAGLLGRALTATWPWLFLGRRPLITHPLPHRWMLLVPAQLLGLLACLGALACLFLGGNAREQIIGLAPVVLALCLMALAGATHWHLFLAAGVLTWANLLGAYVFWEEMSLETYGITGLQVGALALLWNTAYAWLARAAVAWLSARSPTPEDEDAAEPSFLRRLTREYGTALAERRATLLRAGDWVLELSALGVLLLLGLNYLSHSDLSAVNPWRLLASGLMALLVAVALRLAAQRADDAGQARGDFLAGSYQVAVTLALWCLVLLVPPLRQREWALPALALAPLYFLARATWHHHRGPDHARAATRQGHAAAVLAFLLLAIYTFRGAVDLVAYPNARLDLSGYHYGAPVVILLGLILLRLHALGGHWWLAFYGGLSLLVGSYFTVSWLPGCSIFEAPQTGAWLAAGVAHLFLALSHQLSPLRTGVMRLARLSPETWYDLRHHWGLCLQVGAQIALLVGVLAYRDNPYQVAPLLLAAASVALHHGLLGGGVGYLVLAGLQTLLAIHADFCPLTPSYLAKEWVILVFPGTWLALLLAQPWLRAWLSAQTLGRAAIGLAVLTLPQILWHYPEAPIALGVVAGLAVLALATPVASGTALGPGGQVAALLPLLAPAWLAYFANTQWRSGDWLTGVSVPALSALGVATLLSGWLARETARQAWPVRGEAPDASRLVHRSWRFLLAHGWELHGVSLLLASGLGGLILLLHPQTAHPAWRLLLLGGYWTALVIAWYQFGRQRHFPLAYYAWQLCLVGLFLTLRRQLLLTVDFWQPAYDVWVAVLCSFVLAGIKPKLRQQEADLGRSLLVSLLMLPVAALVWIGWHQLDSHLALLVLGCNSLIFAFMGGRDKESPLHALAIGTFLAFVMLLFWQHLHLRAIHACVIPVSLAILGLLQLFGRDLAPATRNAIRLVAVLAMIGATAFYAIADDRYPLTFNLTMILLCLAAMGLGGLLRVRLHVVLGFSGLLIDLASLVYKVVVRLDRPLKMASVGVLLLLLGVALVGGTAWYKTRRASIDAWLERLRERLGSWE